jgi:hypothetical protein
MNADDRTAWDAIFNRLAVAGVTIRLTDEGWVRLKDPYHALDANELAWLKANREELRAYLTPPAVAEPAPEVCAEPEVEFVPEPPASRSGRPPDNYQLYRRAHGSRDAAIYSCHHCSRARLTPEELLPFRLPSLDDHTVFTIVGPGNMCLWCAKEFEEKRRKGLVEMDAAPWPPTWSVEEYRRKQAAKAARKKKGATA